MKKHYIICIGLNAKLKGDNSISNYATEACGLELCVM